MSSEEETTTASQKAWNASILKTLDAVMLALETEGYLVWIERDFLRSILSCEGPEDSYEEFIEIGLLESSGEPVNERKLIELVEEVGDLERQSSEDTPNGEEKALSYVFFAGPDSHYVGISIYRFSEDASELRTGWDALPARFILTEDTEFVEGHPVPSPLEDYILYLRRKEA